MAVQRTFVMVKPGGVQRRLCGEILRRFEAKGLKIVGMKFMQIKRELAELHYAEHKGKDFFEPLVTFITSSPVLAMVLEGEEAISMARRLMGPTRIEEAQPGTIRGDFAHCTRKNLVHGSDSEESATREIGIFFRPEELVSYELDNQRWLSA
jgi:nucleoside-diphosphate kinase